MSPQFHDDEPEGGDSQDDTPHGDEGEDMDESGITDPLSKKMKEDAPVDNKKKGRGKAGGAKHAKDARASREGTAEHTKGQGPGKTAATHQGGQAENQRLAKENAELRTQLHVAEKAITQVTRLVQQLTRRLVRQSIRQSAQGKGDKTAMSKSSGSSAGASSSSDQESESEPRSRTKQASRQKGGKTVMLDSLAENSDSLPTGVHVYEVVAVTAVEVAVAE